MDNTNQPQYESPKFTSSILALFTLEGVDGDVTIAFLTILLLSVVFLVKLIDSLKKYIQAAWQERNQNLIIQPPQPSFNRFEEPCPICFGSISLAVETDCYHLFCGPCMIQLIQHARHRKVTCPVCRAQVSMMYPVFTQDEYNSRDHTVEQNRHNLISEIQEYNCLFSGGSRTLLRTILELPIFIRRLWRSFNNPNDVYVQNRMKTLLYIVLILVAIYIIFPFDLFPEAQFGFLGLLDDMFVILVSIFYVTNFFRSLYFNLVEH